MSSNDYKRVSMIIEHDHSVSVETEGLGEFILKSSEYRIMASAASEMIGGHSASCWQEVNEEGIYLRVVRRKNLCRIKCTRSGMQAVVNTKKEPEQIPMMELKIPKSLKSFNFFNNLPFRLTSKKGAV